MFILIPCKQLLAHFNVRHNVITVGNYANDSGWVNKYGLEPVAETRGKLAASSSKGPTRTGLIKPEIAASGAVTNSTLPYFGIDYFVANNLDTHLALVECITEMEEPPCRVLWLQE